MPLEPPETLQTFGGGGTQVEQAGFTQSTRTGRVGGTSARTAGHGKGGRPLRGDDGQHLGICA